MVGVRWMQKDALCYITNNIAKLSIDTCNTSASSATSNDARDDLDGLRKHLYAVHHITAGQDILISIQLWMDVPGRLGCRQLCPMALQPLGNGRAAATVTTEPVFQFVVGKTYFLTFLVQNRDLASTKRLPFSDVIEVLRLCCVLCRFSSIHHWTACWRCVSTHACLVPKNVFFELAAVVLPFLCGSHCSNCVRSTRTQLLSPWLSHCGEHVTLMRICSIKAVVAARG